jgi:hypothetical protein
LRLESFGKKRMNLRTNRKALLATTPMSLPALPTLRSPPALSTLRYPHCGSHPFRNRSTARFVSLETGTVPIRSSRRGHSLFVLSRWGQSPLGWALSGWGQSLLVLSEWGLSLTAFAWLFRGGHSRCRLSREGHSPRWNREGDSPHSFSGTGDSPYSFFPERGQSPLGWALSRGGQSLFILMALS